MDDEYTVDPNIKPYLRRRMNRPRMHGYDTLCSTIRDTYLLSTDEELSYQCRRAMRASKNLYGELLEEKVKLVGGRRRGAMPYKHKEPVPEEMMDNSRYDGHHSICQTLRDMYHMTEDPEIRLKCRLAMAMAKAMNDQLKRYRNKEE